jgi:hypothetical protein
MADEKTETVEQEQTALTDETLNAEPAAEGKSENPYDWDEPSDPEQTTAEVTSKKEPVATATEVPDDIHAIKDEDVTEEPQESEQEVEFPEPLLDRASELGIAEEDAKRFESPEDLEEFLVPIETRVKSAQKPTPAPRAKAPEPAEEFKLKIDKELIDPEVGDAINSMVEEINRLRGELSSTKSEFDERAESDRMSLFDHYIKELGEDWQDVFGEGSTRDLSRRTKAYQNRMKILDQGKRLSRVYKEEGSTPEDRELWDQARGGLFRTKLDSVARKTLTDKVGSRRKQITARPTNKRGPGEGKKTGKDKALETATKFMRDKGWSEWGDEDDKDAMESFLP